MRNATDQPLEIGFEFTSGATGASGEALVEPCQRFPFPVGEVGGGGTYTIDVDGETVLEATAPASAPEGASMVVRVLVAHDGAVEVLPPAMVAVPELDTATIPGCG